MLTRRFAWLRDTWQTSFWLLCASAITAGWFIPEFYDWTGADQSRAAPIVSWIALAIAAANPALWAILFWWPSGTHTSIAELDRVGAKRWRLSIMHLLIATALAAILLGIGQLTSMLVAAWLLQAIVGCGCLAFAIQFPPMRARIVTLVFCMLIPYLWIVRNAHLTELRWEGLGLLTGLPAFFPAVFLSGFFLGNFHEFQWLGPLLSAAELVVGVWLLSLGPRRSVAASVLAITFSLFGSFVLHALMRA